jgi:hypothetical protein
MAYYVPLLSEINYIYIWLKLTEIDVLRSPGFRLTEIDVLKLTVYSLQHGGLDLCHKQHLQQPHPQIGWQQ